MTTLVAVEEIQEVEAEVEDEQAALTHWYYRMPYAGVKYYVFDNGGTQRDSLGPPISDTLMDWF